MLKSMYCLPLCACREYLRVLTFGHSGGMAGGSGGGTHAAAYSTLTTILGRQHGTHREAPRLLFRRDGRKGRMLTAEYTMWTTTVGPQHGDDQPATTSRRWMRYGIIQ